jgi:predicted translin family RNA/ssDNA-binding protein
MKRPALFAQIQKRHHSHSQARRDLLGKANDALAKSKRAIFALHRDDQREAQALLTKVQKQFVSIEKSFRRFPKLEEEGSYRAALEEYAEAMLFAGYLKTGRIVKLDARVSEPAIYLAGLSDATGEMVRYAIRQVTLGNSAAVAQVQEVVAMIIEFMLDLDLTGYLRTKFDQAKKNLSRLEQMTYDLAIRKNKL